MNEKSLRNLSITYLLLPNFIFFYNWVNGPIGLIGILLLLYLGIMDWRDNSFVKIKILGKRDHLVIASSAFFLTVLSGLTGLVFQNIDYWAHNVKFYELLHSPWPIRYPQDGPVISYYYGFYVMPILFAKLTGTIKELYIFTWAWVGLSFGVAWIYLALNKRIFFVWLVFFIGDLPRVIKSILSIFSLSLYQFGDFGIELWSNFENLLWVPNQTIPTLIIGGMLVYVLIRGFNIELLVLPIALSFWWAIFPAFVSGVIVGFLVVWKWVVAKFQLDWTRVINQVFIPFLVCMPMLIFFFSHEKSAISGFAWEFTTKVSNVVSEYLVNIGVNVVLFVVSYIYFKSKQLPFLDPVPFFFIIILILLFPIYRLGDANDLLVRGMMPILIIVGIYLFYPLTMLTAQKAFDLARNSGIVLILVVMLIFSSLFGITRIFRAITINRITAKLSNSGVSFTPIPYNSYSIVHDVLKEKWSQDAADQYTGDDNSFYEKYIAPRSEN